MASLFRELRRRRLFRTAVIYVIGAWVVVQVADLAFEAWGFQEHALRYVFVGAMLGLPVALFFSWMYNITADGIVRNKPVADGETVDIRLKKFDYAIIATLIIFVIIASYDLVGRIADRQVDSKLADDAQPSDIVDVPPRSVAVLPFAEISTGGESAEFLALGIHNDLLTLLSKVRDMKVISSPSVERYAGTDKVASDIGRELHVATIMKGGVQQASDQVRVSVQLVDTSTDQQIWAESYDRELTAANIFAIQSEIATSIVDHLKVTMTAEEQARLEEVPTANLEAYNHYLLGKQRLVKRTSGALNEAIASFERAIELDPDYALAYVGLADSLVLFQYYGDSPFSDLFPRARKAIETALELDNDLGEAYATLGLIENNNGAYESAEAAFKQALELDPNYARGYHWYAEMLRHNLGRPDEALILIRKALELNPLSPAISSTVGEIYEGLGRFESALEAYQSTIQANPDFAPSYAAIGLLHWKTFAHLDEAIRWLTRTSELDPGNPDYMSWVTEVYLDLGDDVSARAALDKALVLGADQFLPNMAKARLSLFAGDADEAKRAAAYALQIWPGHADALAVLRDADVVADRLDDARFRYEKTHPELIDTEGVQITPANLRLVIDLSMVLQRTGDVERANLLLENSRDVIQSMPRLGVWGFGISDVEIYALEGKKNRALAALRLAIDEGWRVGWWRARSNLNLELLHDEPDFQALLAKIETDMAAQREALRATQ